MKILYPRSLDEPCNFKNTYFRMPKVAYEKIFKIRT